MVRVGQTFASLITAAMLLVCSGAALAQMKGIEASDREAAKRLADYLCTTCHGAEGHSKFPLYPHLAGQQTAYLEAQLHAFRAKTRGDQEAHDYMWGIAGNLNDNIIKGLAEYYSALKPAAGKPGAAKDVAAGKALFEKGDATRGVAPCAACHGLAAEGLSIFPRLAGQQGQYLARQLTQMQTKLRDSPIMHGVIKDLNLDDILVLSIYLQSL